MRVPKSIIATWFGVLRTTAVQLVAAGQLLRSLDVIDGVAGTELELDGSCALEVLVCDASVLVSTWSWDGWCVLVVAMVERRGHQIVAHIPGSGDTWLPAVQVHPHAARLQRMQC